MFETVRSNQSVEKQVVNGNNDSVVIRKFLCRKRIQAFVNHEIRVKYFSESDLHVYIRHQEQNKTIVSFV